jgi:muramidase (phage lysozyme)
MRVPHEVTGRTRPSSQGLNYLNVQYNPNMFGAQLGKALQGFGAALEVSKERSEANKRFDNLVDFTQFETNVKLKLEELKRDTELDAGNFFEQAEAIYQNEQSAFLNTLEDQPAAQNEFEYRAERVRQGVLFDIYEFDFKQQDLFYTTKINEHLEEAKVQLAQNPAVLEEKRDIITGMIESSGLTPIEKEQQLKLANRALESITYKNEVKQLNLSAGQNSRTSIVAQDLPPQAGGILNAIAAGESAGRYDIRFDGSKTGAKIGSFSDHPRIASKIPWNGKQSTAAGKYMFIQGTWDNAAQAIGARDFSPQNQDRAAWYWAQQTYKKQTGGDLNAAINNGDFASIKRALGTQWEAVRTMELEDFVAKFQEGSGMYSDYVALDNDPSFSNLTYADRQTLQNDARIEADRERASFAAQQQAQYDAEYNQLLTNLYDGNAGQREIDDFRQSNQGMSFDDIKKAQTTLEKRLGDDKYYHEGLSKLDSGDMWVQGNGDDTKRANALFNKGGGADAIQARDSEYVNQTLLPRYQRMGMAAPDMANMLMAMTRSPDSTNAVFAYETLRQLRETDPVAFSAQFSPDEQKKLDFYTLRRNYYPEDELIAQAQNRGMDQATIQANSVLRSQADEAIKDLDVDNEIDSAFDTSALPFFGGSETPLTATARVSMQKEFAALYRDNFVAAQGDSDRALELTKQQLQRVWGAFEVGGDQRIMRLPPNKVGYEPHAGSYEWIDASVRRDLGLGPTEEFELLSDERTEKEAIQFFAGKKTPTTDLTKPTYLVVTKDEYGIPRLALDEQGNTLRVDFEVDEATFALEEASYRKEQSLAREETIIQRWQRLEKGSLVDRFMNLLSYEGGLGIAAPDSPLGRAITERNEANAARRKAQLTEAELQELEMLERLIPEVKARRTKRTGENIRSELEDLATAIGNVQGTARGAAGLSALRSPVDPTAQSPTYEGKSAAEYLTEWWDNDSGASILDRQDKYGDVARGIVEFANLPKGTPDRADLAYEIQKLNEEIAYETGYLIVPPPDIAIDLETSYMEALGMEHYLVRAIAQGQGEQALEQLRKNYESADEGQRRYLKTTIEATKRLLGRYNEQGAN